MVGSLGNRVISFLTHTSPAQKVVIIFTHGFRPSVRQKQKQKLAVLDKLK